MLTVLSPTKELYLQLMVEPDIVSCTTMSFSQKWLKIRIYQALAVKFPRKNQKIVQP